MEQSLICHMLVWQCTVQTVSLLFLLSAKLRCTFDAWGQRPPVYEVSRLEAQAACKDI